jgi:hypothetical protein
VQVGTGTATFSQITTSDVVPPAFYLVVSERGLEACQNLAGAWPVGIIRAGGGTPSGSATPPASPTAPAQG